MKFSEMGIYKSQLVYICGDGLQGKLQCIQYYIQLLSGRFQSHLHYIMRLSARHEILKLMLLVVYSRACRLKADIHLVLHSIWSTWTPVIFYWPMVRVPDQADHHRRCSHAADGLSVLFVWLQLGNIQKSIHVNKFQPDILSSPSLSVL